jgi:uncharacterized protein
MVEKKKFFQKLRWLQNLIKSLNKVVVAYSGGLDSSVLLKVALGVLGSKSVLAVTSNSVIHPPAQIQRAQKIAKKLGVKHILINTNELAAEEFARNDEKRCYVCKKKLYTKVQEIAKEYAFSSIIDGTNADDVKEQRPGSEVLAELGIVVPLANAGLGNKEVKLLAQEFSLPFPPQKEYCLASRFSYGIRITEKEIKKIIELESWLRENGFKGAIVRYHSDKLARIKVKLDSLSGIANPERRGEILKKFRERSFKSVALDLEGLPCKQGRNDST